MGSLWFTCFEEQLFSFLRQTGLVPQKLSMQTLICLQNCFDPYITVQISNLQTLKQNCNLDRALAQDKRGENAIVYTDEILQQTKEYQQNLQIGTTLIILQQVLSKINELLCFSDITQMQYISLLKMNLACRKKRIYFELDKTSFYDYITNMKKKFDNMKKFTGIFTGASSDDSILQQISQIYIMFSIDEWRQRPMLKKEKKVKNYYQSIWVFEDLMPCELLQFKIRVFRGK